jgi:hypothetical protein
MAISKMFYTLICHAVMITYALWDIAASRAEQE